MKRAFITGITGQDGSYLAEFLLNKGYEVYGLVRRASTYNANRIDHLQKNISGEDPRLKLVYGDLNDGSSLSRLIMDIRPDEVYNLGAQSHVRISFDTPEYTAQTTGLGAVRLLEALRGSGIQKTVKFYQASSSELYGDVLETPQRETTPFNPRSPYAAAKAYAFYVTKNYRDAYGMFAVNGILFNHESPRRGEDFVTRKITLGLARIKYGLQEKLGLGNLDAKRDWGYAEDYVEAMWMMLQQARPDDFVIATGKTHTIREFLEVAADTAKIDWRDVVVTDPSQFRPTEVNVLLGDATKARRVLGWSPKVSFEKLAQMMMEEDLKLVDRQIRGIDVEEKKQRRSR